MLQILPLNLHRLVSRKDVGVEGWLRAILTLKLGRVKLKVYSPSPDNV